MPIFSRLQYPGAVVLVASSLFFIPSARAQSAHPVSIGAGYTFVRTNVLPGCNCVGLQGGSGEVQYGFGPHLAGVADATVAHRGGITPDGYSLTQLSYTFGVRYWPVQTRVRPFADLRAGGAHAFGNLSPANNIGGASGSAFALEAGGGLHIALGKRLLLEPIKAEYLLTTFQNNAANRQNDLRISAGVMLRLGR